MRSEQYNFQLGSGNNVVQHQTDVLEERARGPGAHRAELSTMGYVGRGIAIGLGAMLVGGAGTGVVVGPDRIHQGLMAMAAPVPSEIPLANGVYSEMQSRLTDSTLTLWRAPNGNSENAVRICTATKVEQNNISFILTAAHCLKENPETKRTTNEPGIKQATGLATEKYFVADPTPTPYNQHPSDMVARVVDGATNNQNDWALLSAGTVRGKENAYDHIPALPLSSFTNTSKKPGKIGDQVAMSGYPAEASALMEQKGMYLGRGNSKQRHGSLVYDFVGFNAQKQEENPCRPGFSGSQADVADKALLGPLKGAIANTDIAAKRQVAAIAYDLPFSATNFNVICQYSVTRKNVLDQMAESLQQ